MYIFRFQRDIVDVVLVLFLARTIGTRRWDKTRGCIRGEVLLAFFFFHRGERGWETGCDNGNGMLPQDPVFGYHVHQV